MEAREEAASGPPPRAPRVSVCIPTYNYARYLGPAIESVLAQTFADFELIVCDDASTDDTRAVLEQFDDPRMRVTFNPVNLGLFPNFNRCLELARGEYVKLLCADDWLDARYLAEAVNAMDAHPSAGLLTAPGYLVDDEGHPFAVATAGFGRRPLIPAAEALRRQADFLNPIGMPSNVLLRSSALQAVGHFDEAFAPAGDVHLWIRMLDRFDLAWLPDPRCFLRIHRRKSHDYGFDPTESPFLAWEDAAKGVRVDRALLDRARLAEAERCLLYVAVHLAHGRFAQAREILRFVGRHVGWGWALPRLAAGLPGLLRGQVARLLAPRLSRMVVYSPRPRLGPPVRG